MRMFAAFAVCWGMTVALGAESLPAHGLTTAEWRGQHVDFLFRGRTARYSCAGLRQKVRAMLFDLGVRRDAKIAAVMCGSGALSMDFFALALRDAVAQRPRGADRASVEAHFGPFTIASDTFRNIGTGDCELVTEFARQILPKLATRNVNMGTPCVIRGEILRKVPRAK